jgi:hypothetical protein
MVQGERHILEPLFGKLPQKYFQNGVLSNRHQRLRQNGGVRL